MEPLLDCVRGFLYTFLWVATMAAGQSSYTYLALATICVHPPLHAKINDFCLAIAYIYSRFLSYLFGIRMVVSGDRLRSAETAILICNHRTRTDWNFIAGLQPQIVPNICRAFKTVSKHEVQHIPFYGWFLQMSGTFFITRRWKDDESLLDFYLSYFVSTLRSKIQLLMFPEGVNLYNQSKAKSDWYAEVQGLPKYNHVLHPRTTGFAYVVDFLRKEKTLGAIYDITIAYPDKLPFLETDILKGKLPREVHVHIQRTAESDLPLEKVEIENWLKKRWFEKEERLKNFFEIKKFSDECWPQPGRWVLFVAAAYFFVVKCCTFGLMIYLPLFRWVTILQWMFFVGLSLSKFNFTDLTIAYHAFWNKHLKSKMPFMNWLDWLCEQLEIYFFNYITFNC